MSSWSVLGIFFFFFYISFMVIFFSFSLFCSIEERRLGDCTLGEGTAADGVSQLPHWVPAWKLVDILLETKWEMSMHIKLPVGVNQSRFGLKTDTLVFSEEGTSLSAWPKESRIQE